MHFWAKRDVVEKIVIGLGLIGLTIVLYLIHYSIFHDAHHLLSYFLLHLAFLPVHALVLGMIIDSLLVFRERNNRRKKLSMLLGIFFRQIGVDVLVIMVAMVDNRDLFDELVMVGPDWSPATFKQSERTISEAKFWIKSDPAMLEQLATVIMDKEDMISQMARNPHLLEFERLHKALVGLFHLIEEFHFRRNIKDLPVKERDHLANDISKTIVHLSVLWLEYLRHLKIQHPILFQHQVGIHNVVDPSML